MLSPQQIIHCKQALLQAFKWLGKHTPFLNSLLSFGFQAHRQALPKFLILWTLSSLPVLFAILLSKIPAGDTTLWRKFGAKLQESVTVSETFVYAAGFMTPVLYIIIQRYLTSGLKRDKSLAEQFKRNLNDVFRGYIYVWISALIVLMLTAVAFASDKTDPVVFKETFLAEVSSTAAPMFYVFSLFCWYLTLCDDFIDGFDYPDASRASENELADDFSTRIHQRGTEQ